MDVVNFGEEAENTTKLDAFVQAVNSSDNRWASSGVLALLLDLTLSGMRSHLVNIPPGPHILSDVLLSSPILSGEEGVPAGFGGGGGGAGFEFGVDPSLDPELALALRISLEEERARQEAMARAEGGGAAAAPSGTEPAAAGVGSGDAGDVDAALAQALALSQGQPLQEDVQMDDLTEEEQIARAIALSMGGEGSASVRSLRGFRADSLLHGAFQ